VVQQARTAAGCLDYAISPDLVEPGRINIYERWESHAAVAAFRGDGPSDAQTAAMTHASVAEYEVGEIRSLT
jgi:quinol monooxygenase YgiN